MTIISLPAEGTTKLPYCPARSSRNGDRIATDRPRRRHGAGEPAAAMLGLNLVGNPLSLHSHRLVQPGNICLDAASTTSGSEEAITTHVAIQVLAVYKWFLYVGAIEFAAPPRAPQRHDEAR